MRRQRGWLSERQWRMTVLSMPIPCVDVIVQKKSKILIGFRAIDPYRNVWALPGDRILRHEYPEDTVHRTLAKIGITCRTRNLVGVFPVMFPRHALKRYDISLCYSAEWVAGEPKPDAELLRFRWVTPRKLPANIGANYKKMIQKASSLNQAKTTGASQTEMVKSAVAEKLTIHEVARAESSTNIPSWVPEGKYVALVRGAVAAAGDSVAEVVSGALTKFPDDAIHVARKGKSIKAVQYAFLAQTEIRCWKYVTVDQQSYPVIALPL